MALLDLGLALHSLVQSLFQLLDPSVLAPVHLALSPLPSGFPNTIEQVYAGGEGAGNGRYEGCEDEALLDPPIVDCSCSLHLAEVEVVVVLVV